MRKINLPIIIVIINVIICSCQNANKQIPIENLVISVSESPDIKLHKVTSDSTSQIYFSVRDTITGYSLELKNGKVQKKVLYYDGEPTYEKLYYWSDSNVDSICFFQISQRSNYLEYLKLMVWEPNKNNPWFEMKFQPVTSDTKNNFNFTATTEKVYMFSDKGIEYNPAKLEKGDRLNGKNFTIQINPLIQGYNYSHPRLLFFNVDHYDDAYDYYTIKNDITILLPVFKTNYKMNYSDYWVIF